MSRQIIIGFATEGSTDNRFLESIIQRSFEEMAFDCNGDVEVLPVQTIKKQGGDFLDVVKSYAQQADEQGVMVLCVHVDADAGTDANVFSRKIDPAFNAVYNLQEGLLCKNLVAIVPVQMLEAWMLAGKDLLKAEIGTTKSDQELGIEHFPETYNDPKETIQNAIRIARQELTQRRRKELTITELYFP